MKRETEIIILSESLWQGVARDISTFLTLASLVALGWALESTPLQWVGALLGMVWIIGRASRLSKRMSIAEARIRLDELEAEQEGR